jgi:hypothetical protein
MTKGAKTAAAAAVVLGLGVAGWYTYKHFSKGTAPKGAPLSGGATKPAGPPATDAGASIAVAGLNALAPTLNAINGFINPPGTG